MRNTARAVEAKSFQEIIRQCLGWPNTFAPPACLEFSLCALLDSWTLLWYGQEGKETWRKLWLEERRLLHGTTDDRYLSDPVGRDRSFCLTYSIDDTLNQSYRQVADAVRNVFQAMCNRHATGASAQRFEDLKTKLGPLIEIALEHADMFGQPAGLECYTAMSLSLFESLLQIEPSTAIVGTAWHAEVEKMTTDIPIHVRRLRDVLPKREKYERERAIPPEVWENCQQQVVSGFEQIIRSLRAVFPDMNPDDRAEKGSS